MKDVTMILCDDEPLQRDYVLRMVREWGGERKEKVHTKVYSSGHTLIKDVSGMKEVDIALLDMEMDDISGLQVAESIRKHAKDAIIIFVTGYREYVFDVFEIGAFRYLLKPIDKQLFHKALSDAMESLETRDEKIAAPQFLEIHKNKEVIYIEYSSIIYLEKYKNKVIVKSEKQDIDFYGSFSELSELMEDERFIRVHQGYIANMDKMELVTSKDVHFKNGTYIPVSRRHGKDVRDTFLERLRKTL